MKNFEQNIKLHDYRWLELSEAWKAEQRAGQLLTSKSQQPTPWCLQAVHLIFSAEHSSLSGHSRVAVEHHNGESSAGQAVVSLITLLRFNLKHTGAARRTLVALTTKNSVSQGLFHSTLLSLVNAPIGRPDRTTSVANDNCDFRPRRRIFLLFSSWEPPWSILSVPTPTGGSQAQASSMQSVYKYF